MSDLIVGTATARGSSAVSIVRISGDNAAETASKIFFKKGLDLAGAEANKMYLGKIVAGIVSDKAFCMYCRAPKSYTGEDVVEFHLHGGRVVAEAVTEALMKLGARPAEPGEFTRRAYLNGKMSLSEAEGVEAMIAADSEAEAAAAYRALSGELDRTIRSVASLLVEAAAATDVALDYPDEMIEDTKPQIYDALSKAKSTLERVIGTETERKMTFDGISVVLAGLVNAGKSSLMNALCGADRAIVTEYAGTTRDVLRERLEINGVKVTLSDTAGIRENAEGAEKIGIERAEEAVRGADVVLFVMDGSVPECDEERALYNKIKTRAHIRVKNKGDLKDYPREADVTVSCLTGENIDKLRRMIAEKTGIRAMANPPLVRERQLFAAQGALRAVDEALDKLVSGTPDIVSHHIKEALALLAALTGDDAAESVVDEIFSRFCVGK